MGATDKTIIADDHPLFREALRRIIQRVTSSKIVEVADARSLLREAENSPQPTLMLLDLVFPGFESAKSIGQLRQRFPQTVLIVVSMSEDKNTIDKVIRAGANGFISKSVSAEEMAKAIEQILDGEIVVCVDADPSFEGTFEHLADTLPKRHLDVLVHLAQGKTNKEIARDLGISPFTVRAHISALFKSLGVTTRAKAAALAVAHGLV